MQGKICISWTLKTMIEVKHFTFSTIIIIYEFKHMQTFSENAIMFHVQMFELFCFEIIVKCSLNLYMLLPHMLHEFLINTF